MRSSSSAGRARAVRRPVLRRCRYVTDLLGVLLGRDLKLRYKRSFLGMVWSLVTPLAQLVVFHFVFTAIVPLGIPDYAVFLFIGIIVWSWLQSSLQQASTVIVDNRDLVRRPGFPTAVLPVVAVGANLIQFLIALPILLIFLLVEGSGLEPTVLGMPLLLALQFALVLGLAYYLAALNVSFRDTQHLLSVALTLGFFLTPVFYRASDVPARYASLYGLNPMVHLTDAYRSILLRGEWPAISPLLFIGAGALVLLWTGFLVFRRASHRFAEEL